MSSISAKERLARGERFNTVKSYFGALDDPRIQDEGADVQVKQYVEGVGSYAKQAIESGEIITPLPAPAAEVIPPPVEADPRAGLPPPAKTTSASAKEYIEAMKKHTAVSYDPEDRFSEPPTSNMVMGWGARKAPRETCRHPKVISEVAKAHAQLMAMHSAHD